MLFVYQRTRLQFLPETHDLIQGRPALIYGHIWRYGFGELVNQSPEDTLAQNPRSSTVGHKIISPALLLVVVALLPTPFGLTPAIPGIEYFLLAIPRSTTRSSVWHVVLHPHLPCAVFSF